MEPSVTNIANPDTSEISSEDIEQMLKELFESMLGMEISKSDERPDETLVGGFCGRIIIDGAWPATIDVSATKSLSDKLGCNMFDCDIDSLKENDLSDAIGEVANVIGGNVKGIIDQDCNLSIPEVGKIQSETRLTGSNTYWFDCEGDCLRVELKQNNPEMNEGGIQ